MGDIDIQVFQDGNRFYSKETGHEIFRSPIVVKDFDMHAANLARAEFKDWAERFGYNITWEGPTDHLLAELTTLCKFHGFPELIPNTLSRLNIHQRAVLRRFIKMVQFHYHRGTAGKNALEHYEKCLRGALEKYKAGE